MNTDAEVMGWIMDTYSMFQGYTVPGVVTGKPVEIGGSLGRKEATGRGVMLMTRELLHRVGMPVMGTRIAIQGLGNVGSVTAKLLNAEGCKIVAVSNVSGGLYKKEGINMANLLEFLKGNSSRSLKEYDEKGVEYITNQEALICECDVLIPAALENHINETVADKIKAKVIVEGANGPTTVEADTILEKKGIKVIPDILSNAGGVVVSYFEWVQNIQNLTWDEDEVNRTLEKIMIKAFNEVWNKAAENNSTLRMGVYAVALDRVVKAKKIRGVFP